MAAALSRFHPSPSSRRLGGDGSLVQRAIEQQERLIALTTELKKALMHKLFTEGLRGEPKSNDRNRPGAGELGGC